MAQKPLPITTKLVVSASAGVSGWMFVHPLDVIKVRSQLLGESLVATGNASPAEIAQASRLRTVAGNLYRHEGVRGLYGGLSAAIARQLSYTSIRLSAYDVLKEAVQGEARAGQPLALWEKFACGIGAGGFGSFCACPIEVSLVRMQADGRLPSAERRGYAHVLDALRRIGAEEGALTYWRGATPTVARAAVVAATQLGSYDQAKEVYRDALGVAEGAKLHLMSAVTAGFIYSLVSLPLDTAKTRTQSQKPLPDGSLKYRGVVGTVARIAREEGPLSLWRGFTSYFLRGGGHTVGMFMFLEQYRKIARRWHDDD